MKNYIEYFYKFMNIKIIKDGLNYSFIYDDNNYLFIPLMRSEKEIMEVAHLLQYNKEYDQIISNYQGLLVTTIGYRKYILVKENNKKKDILDSIVNAKKIENEYKQLVTIDKSDWIRLWSEKIDYIEYQMIHLDGKYKILQSSVNYYIGMAEIAISYINNVLTENKNIKKDLVISHKRIVVDKFDSPLNIIIDYRGRDIAEYLKYIFFENSYDYYKIKKMLLKLNLDSISCQFIYGRLFYVTFYFDFYELIVDEKRKEKSIEFILSRVEEYEDYIRNIYSILNEIHFIPEIIEFF